MPAFRYKALDGEGRFVTGEIQAESTAAVEARLGELGYLPLETVARRAPNAQVGWRRLMPQPRLAARDVTVVIRDLALLLRAGLPLDEALRLLGDDAGAVTGHLLVDVRRAIESGTGFADALAAHPEAFSGEVVAMVRVAEAAGGLDTVMENLAEDRARRERISAKVVGALRYPIFLLLVASGVLVFFLMFVVPQFATVLRDFGGEPDPLVATVLGLSDWMNKNGEALGLTLVAAGLAIFLALRSARLRNPLLRFLRRTPGIRGVVELRRAASICRSLATLLASGVTLSDALKVMTDAGGVDAEALGKVQERVRRGGRLVDALTETAIVPALAARMLRVGEESGELAVVARRAADYYESKLGERLDKLAAVVGPAAIVVISVVIGGLIVSIMSTLLGINQVAL
jgi:general secretion pathway protein F